MQFSVDCPCLTISGIGYSNVCNLKGGQCPCKDEFAGGTCEECNDGYYDFPNCKGLYLLLRHFK